MIKVTEPANAEVMAEGQSGLGRSIGSLPDGRILVTGNELTVTSRMSPRRPTQI